jgi:hypothetical protein
MDHEGPENDLQEKEHNPSGHLNMTNFSFIDILEPFYRSPKRQRRRQKNSRSVNTEDSPFREVPGRARKSRTHPGDRVPGIQADGKDCRHAISVCPATGTTSQGPSERGAYDPAQNTGRCYIRALPFSFHRRSEKYQSRIRND